MHLIKDENGNLIQHGHEHTHQHTHADGVSHTHAHTHDGSESHDHTHNEGQNCSTDCGGCQGGDCKNETVALLTYMLQHNGLVGDDVAEEVVGQDHVEAGRVGHHLPSDMERATLITSVYMTLQLPRRTALVSPQDW